MAIKKIPCGGFSYDDTEIAFENGVIHPIGGGGGGWPSDLPKPSVGGYGYTESGVETILVDNESVTTVDDEDVAVGQFTTPFDIVDGAYTVIFNGTEYNLNSVFFEERGFWYLGDIPERFFDFSRYPFNIVVDGEGAMLLTESAGDYDVTIKKTESEAIHKIDEKYLPDGGGGGIMVVNAFYNEITNSCVVDKTFEEICESSPNVILVLQYPDDDNPSFLNLVYKDMESVGFQCVFYSLGAGDGKIIGIDCTTIVISYDGYVEFNQGSVAY